MFYSVSDEDMQLTVCQGQILKDLGREWGGAGQISH